MSRKWQPYARWIGGPHAGHREWWCYVGRRWRKRGSRWWTWRWVRTWERLDG